MIDIHCHILPGIDDGPATLEQSLDMARFCVADGINCVIATPHCHRYVHMLRKDILPAVERFNEELERAHIDLTILPGSEIQVTDSAEYRREFDANLLCHLGDKGLFTLIEFNWARGLFPADAPELVRWILERGSRPILAHPERHDFFARDPTLLDEMVEAGAWVQITVDSMLGNHGPDPQKMADAYLRKFPQAIVATDAHNLLRCSGLSAGYAWAKDHLEAGRADDLHRRADALESQIRQSQSNLTSAVC